MRRNCWREIPVFLRKTVCLSFLVSVLLSSWTSLAQKNARTFLPKGQFLQDSIQVGTPVQFSLSYHHNPAADIFFPDSSYNFAPFELVNRSYFPTNTQHDISVDSVVYTLVSFEVEPVQSFRLPVYIRTPQDCTSIWSPSDIIFFKNILPTTARPDTLHLQPDTTPYPMRQQANYPFVAAIFFALSVVGALIFWLFGKPIRRQISLFQFRRRYDEFQRIFQRLSRPTDDSNRRVENVEKALILWKKYIERLENKPFTTFTTKEILDNLKDTRLSDALREIDATIYGGNYSSKTLQSLAILQELAEGLYREHRQLLLENTL